MKYHREEEYEFPCPHCGEDLVFEGNEWEAEADCPECLHVTICPKEILDERAADVRSGE